jgi:hypothetical protein
VILVETQARYARLVERVAAHFHRHRSRALGLELSDQRVQANRIGRGVAGFFQRTDPTGADGAEIPASDAGLFERLRHQIGRAGLAIGAGDGDGKQLTGRLAHEAAGEFADALAEIDDGDLRYRQVVRLGNTGRGFPQHRRRPAIKRHLDVLQTVAADALHGQEGVAGTDAA